MRKVVVGFSAYIEKEVYISDDLYDGIIDDTAETLEPIFDQVANNLPPCIELGDICCIKDKETDNIIAEY